MCGEERRELFPEVLADDLSDSRAECDGDRRLQLTEVVPLGTRSSRRSGLRDRGRHSALGPAGGDLRFGRGDLVLVVARSRSYGDLDLLLRVIH